MRCRLLPHLLADGPRQMAIDLALLDAVDEHPNAAVFRTYEWSPPTLSLGYFQTTAERDSDPRWSPVPCVRRPSGGGALWHDRELTYALVVPRAHPLAGQPAELYRGVHQAIADGLQERGIAATLRGDAETKSGDFRPFLCFQDRDSGDVLINGSKVVGSAQRRRSLAVLQHGAILLARSERTPELPGLADLCVDPPSIAWMKRIHQWLPKALGLDPIEDDLGDAEIERASALEEGVFRKKSWILRR